MMGKKKRLGIGTLVMAAIAGLVFVLVPLWGTQTQTVLEDNQNYVYACVNEIQGNEITYMELEESVVTAYLERQAAVEETAHEVEEGEAAEKESGDRTMENIGERQTDGEMPDEPSGEAPGGEKPSGDALNGERNTEITTTLIPVGVIVHTQSDVETTFRRLASGDIIKMLVETTEDGEEVITEIWML